MSQDSGLISSSCRSQKSCDMLHARYVAVMTALHSLPTFGHCLRRVRLCSSMDPARDKPAHYPTHPPHASRHHAAAAAALPLSPPRIAPSNLCFLPHRATAAPSLVAQSAVRNRACRESHPRVCFINELHTERGTASAATSIFLHFVPAWQ